MAKKHHPLKSDALCPALEALIGDGVQITLGAVGPVRNAAIAAMPAGMLAALVRRKGETLPQILQRLDAAIVQAVVENRVINDDDCLGIGSELRFDLIPDLLGSLELD